MNISTIRRVASTRLGAALLTAAAAGGQAQDAPRQIDRIMERQAAAAAAQEQSASRQIDRIIERQAAAANAQALGASGGPQAFEAALLSRTAWRVGWVDANDEQKAGSAVSRFEHRDGRLFEVFENSELQRTCTSEVELRADGFTTLGCTSMPTRWVHDASDAAYPFKGTSSNGYQYWLGPLETAR